LNPGSSTGFDFFFKEIFTSVAYNNECFFYDFSFPFSPHPRKQPFTMNVVDLSLTGFLNKFREYRAADAVPNHPTPDMIAARFALTGRSMGGASVAGINTARDKIGAQGTRPYIRRDFNSLIGFSTDLIVQTNITFFPNPPVIAR
jgi:hypothetical protein